VLGLVADGQLNKQIADRLGIQERTIKAHLSLIFQKLGVRNRTQASVMLRSLELGDPAHIVVDDEGED
jgi:DNA-binding NarL/FixJ family response regulator